MNYIKNNSFPNLPFHTTIHLPISSDSIEIYLHLIYISLPIRIQQFIKTT
ncbi:hypothetical protein BFAG_02492 [Bacteroides fragilis 3_1_12]|uniref:Uncharacterized protein n=1 Tax=Bacteroides fragilis 3_1_12 TaxID=457424 RepID=A0ABN0BLI3_BACFG|nr:hypothetical protein BFAG_02492 [Bacteroides fragilis 3_1_12]